MGDEGTFFETAQAIATGAYQPSIFDLGVYSYPILSSFWQAWILKIFGIGLWGWRFASVLPAVLTVFPLYMLSRDLFGRGVGLVSSLVMIFSPYFLAFSRLGYNNSQSILVVVLCIWLVYMGNRKGSFLYSFLGGAISGLGFLTYTAGRLGLAIVGLYFVSLFLAKSLKTKRKQLMINAVLPFMVGLIIVAAPNIIYNQQKAPQISMNKMVEGLFFQAFYGRDFYREEELVAYNPLLKVDQHEFFYNPQIYAELIVRGIARSLLAFHHEDLVSEHFISDSLSGPYATIFYIFGAFLVFSRLRDRKFLLIAIWFASGLFFLSIISTYPPRHQHLVPVIPAMAIMIGLGVVAFSRQYAAILTSRHKTRQKLQFTMAVVIVIAIGCVGLREFFVVMPNMYRPHLEQVMNWFGLHNSADIDYVYIHTEPVHDEWRPYLFRELLQEHEFRLLSLDQFLRSSEPNLSTDSGIAIFYGQEHAAQITLKLLQTIPDTQVITYLNRDEQVIGRAVIQGNVTIPSSASFLSGLLGVFNSPVIWLLCPLLLFIFYYWYKYRQDISILLPFTQQAEARHDPIDLSNLITDQSEELPETKKKPFIKVEKGVGYFEISIHIRLELGNHIHSIQPKLSIHTDKEKVSSK
jgi:4-amino-4-deoxy-L-arabinose transferase-like glycosyltransferase